MPRRTGRAVSAKKNGGQAWQTITRQRLPPLTYLVAAIPARRDDPRLMNPQTEQGKTCQDKGLHSGKEPSTVPVTVNAPGNAPSDAPPNDLAELAKRLLTLSPEDRASLLKALQLQPPQ